MQIRDRLHKIIEYKNLTPTSFAKKIGVSSQRFGNYLRDRDPDYDTLRRICETFVEISAIWLLTGQGEMIQNQSSENIYLNRDTLKLLTLQQETIANLQRQLALKDVEIIKLNHDLRSRLGGDALGDVEDADAG